MPSRLLVLAGVFVLPATAMAHGDVHPRTPIIWDPSACMTVVDRQVDPVLGLRYSIPYEDTAIPPEEVADSRRHQFFGLCRDVLKWGPDAPPNWITDADVAAAAALALVDPLTLLPEDILTSSAAWEGCWTRITGDDERRPITFEAAMEPVLWDTSGLPIGPQVVLGYTWEPPYNVWRKRSGVVQIVDDLDPAVTPPALAISTTGLIAYEGEDVSIAGCVRAMAGATLTASWAEASDPLPTWIPFAEQVPVTGESFAMPFVAPPEAINTSVLIRVEIVDPLGRHFTALMDELVTILHQPAPPMETGAGESSSGENSSADDSSGAPSEAPQATGCGCAAPVGPPAWAALLLLLARRRRARR